MGVLKPFPGGRKVSSVLGGVLLAASMWFDERLATYAMADMRLCCVALFVPRRGVASAGGARRGGGGARLLAKCAPEATASLCGRPLSYSGATVYCAPAAPGTSREGARL